MLLEGYSKQSSSEPFTVTQAQMAPTPIPPPGAGGGGGSSHGLGGSTFRSFAPPPPFRVPFFSRLPACSKGAKGVSGAKGQGGEGVGSVPPSVPLPLAPSTFTLHQFNV